MGFRAHISGGIEVLERQGPGPVLMLLHGIGSEAASFAPVLPHLPGDWRVIAWNAPGYGRSAPLSEDWPLAADYAAALGRLLDTLVPGPVLLAGHSLGALMAAALGVARPALVARLLLAAPALGHGVPRGGRLGDSAQARLDDLERLGPEAFAEARAPRLVHDPGNHPAAVARVRDSMARLRLPGYAQAVRMLAAGRLPDDAERLTLPTDVLVGAEDGVTPPEGARRVHAALAGPARGRFTELPGCGHAIHAQAPAAFAAALAALAEPAC